MVPALHALRQQWERLVLAGIASVDDATLKHITQLATELGAQLPALDALCAKVHSALAALGKGGSRANSFRLQMDGQNELGTAAAVSAAAHQALTVLAELARTELLLSPLASVRGEAQGALRCFDSAPELLPSSRTHTAEWWRQRLSDTDEAQRDSAAQWFALQTHAWLAQQLTTMTAAEHAQLAGLFVPREETETWLFLQLESLHQCPDVHLARLLACCLLAWSTRLDVSAQRVAQLVELLQRWRLQEPSQDSAWALLDSAAIEALVALKYERLWALVNQRGALERQQWTGVLKSAMASVEPAALDWIEAQKLAPTVQSWELELLERRAPRATKTSTARAAK
jgi:hypothetical protein